MLFAVITFFLSFVGIIVLFTVKYLEVTRERIFAPSLRDHADRRALVAKKLLETSGFELSKFVPAAVIILRYFVHEAALGFAALARIAESQAHRLADMVSYKHRFEKRAPRSEFLKQVADRKTGLPEE